VSVRPSVSTRVFETTDLFTSIVCMCMGHNHACSSPGIKSRHSSRSSVRVGIRVRVEVRVVVSKDGNAVGLTSMLSRGQFFSVHATEC